MEPFSYLNNTNAAYIDELHSSYLNDPESVDSSWKYFFQGIELGLSGAAAVSVEVDFSSEVKVADLINAYRDLGRLVADLDPLSPPPAGHPLLELSRFELSEADLDREFTAARLLGMERAPLWKILERLRETYCASVGVEFTHIHNFAERSWLQERMEGARNRMALPVETRKFIYERLARSEGFERFLHTRYVAQKRFSLEGGEAVITALDCMIEVAGQLGAEQVVFGMAHRGRLNVLANIFGKRPEYIFTEFEGNYSVDSSAGEGDVKYHLGYSADFATRQGKKLHLTLVSNPSHLEFVNPVIEGIARAKQDLLGDQARTRVIPVAIHGDAAFAGQGVCYETLNLAQLDGYSSGGTLHLVINNQIGFTASPKESRSTTYATDLAKMLEVPIFHVNGDDPEAVWYVARLCAEYRQKFNKDVFIDLLCYRRHGHNEGDEPSFTQPALYSKVKAHPGTRQIYGNRLLGEGVFSREELQAVSDALTERYTQAQGIARAEAPHPPISAFEGEWKGFRATSQKEGDPDLFKPVKTSVSVRELLKYSEKLNRIPENFKLHPKLQRFFETRLRTVQDGKNIDWGNGEVLAYATLLMEGHRVRLSGQDAGRGTFTHRHAVLHDVETGEKYLPLNHLSNTQARFEAYNSHLSEAGVLGFEHGYSLADPQSLVIWEAQFGDFANSAQVIIDQFISSSESKWLRYSGLVLLLPHGMEGQGPEHSSARLERFLQLCGKNNLIVSNLTTPAQLFHALRRQLARDFRKPLVIASPKSLLRNAKAVSTIEEFAEGSFQEVLDDTTVDKFAVKKILLCSGKIYYDLLLERDVRELKTLAIIRIEQLYPWPVQKLAQILKKYSKARQAVWVQEEPRNMGAWSYVFGVWSGGLSDFSEKVDGLRLGYVGREIGAAPAVGSAKLHEREQKALLDGAMQL
ncbi:MAG: 2-oxoglutarate dehydrogenase E1 component [Bdellovibrionales bacterium GWA1_52_35]|nr:MAG: 2-oxoglutarate dehydrogenase E1 component [Bdellovibrionales bacterium GWA1_52_35]HCM40555.1 2-oxoglutarate dehydrogenase E1 component [Bdellovibrionales bacterium]